MSRPGRQRRRREWRARPPTSIIQVRAPPDRAGPTGTRGPVGGARAPVPEVALYRAGRHFLQLPGPTNVPDRVLRAMDRPVIDHRGPGFARLTLEVLAGLADMVRTEHPVVIHASSATGAWEAALANTLSPGDRVLALVHGFFAAKWAEVAERLGLEVERVPGDWRRAADPDDVAARLSADREGRIRAVLLVHNETSTGVRADVAGVREAMDRVGHPALFMVDTVSSLASMDYRHDAWGVDVMVTGSQKGLMLPPGLAFNALSEKALEAHRGARLPRAYWDWSDLLTANERGFFPSTPGTSLLFGLRESLAMLAEEGLETVFARHARLAAATRRAVEAWGLETVCADPAAHSDSLTAVLTPEGHDADELREVILDRFDLSLGTGLGELKGRAFRIGHLGDLNELTLLGALAGVELGLRAAGVPHRSGGVDAAMEALSGETAAGPADGQPSGTRPGPGVELGEPEGAAR